MGSSKAIERGVLKKIIRSNEAICFYPRTMKEEVVNSLIHSFSCMMRVNTNRFLLKESQGAFISLG